MDFVKNSSGISIAIRHSGVSKEKVIIVAPGFFQSKDTKTFQEMQKDIEKFFGVISMDFRGHGKSGGWFSFSALEKEDLKAVIDYARLHHKKVGVLGFSYGGCIAMITAVEFHNIDSLICVSAPLADDEVEFRWWRIESIRLALRGFERGAGVRPGYPYFKKIRPIDIVDQISPAPIFFIHGAKDPTVDVRHSSALYEKAKEPKAIKLFEKGSHAEEIYRKFPNEFIETVTDWFQKTLR